VTADRGGRLAGALLAATIVAGAGCGGHKAAKPARAAAPTASVALPRVDTQAQAEFEEGLRVMRTGRKHYKEADGG